MSTTRQTNESVTGYKQQLIRVRDLRTEAGANAYDRATLLVAVHGDAQFQDEFPEEHALPILDEHVDDLCLTFLEIATLLKHRPDKAAWADGKLRTLYAAVQKEVDDARTDATPKRTVKRVTLKAFDELNEQNSRNEARVEHLRTAKEQADETIHEQTETIGSLRRRVTELETENRLLRERVSELERLLRGSEVSA